MLCTVKLNKFNEPTMKCKNIYIYFHAFKTIGNIVHLFSSESKIRSHKQANISEEG